MSLIPGKDDEEMAWQALRRRVADQAIESSFEDDKKRVRNMEDRLLLLLQKVELVMGHYQDLTAAYDRLVTRIEFSAFKSVVFCLCVSMGAILLLLLSKGK